VRVASRLSRGVASVQAQHAPYAAAWHEANRGALAIPGPRWIVLGDSMSQGIGADAFDSGWVNQLQARLDRQLPIVNLSASGARVPDVLQQQLPAWQALPAETDLVTVLIGSNDLLSRAHRDPLPARVTELLGQLPKGAVVATMPQPRAAARAVNAVLVAAAERGDIHIVDLRATGPSSWRGRLAADHFHPNELGYAGIADAFEAPVRRALASL